MVPVTNNPDGEQQSSSTRRAWLWLALGGLLAGGIVAFLLLRFVPGIVGPPSFNGVVMQSPQPMSNFTLTAHTGAEAQLVDFRGQVVLIYFGYTYCPDVCPATMTELADAVQALQPSQREQVQVLMVSVDPERDTPAVLADYVTHFDPSFIGLSGTMEEVTAAATPFGIFFQKRDGTADSGYLVDHTATVVALDKDGYLRLVYPFGTSGEEIAADLRYLVRD